MNTLTWFGRRRLVVSLLLCLGAALVAPTQGSANSDGFADNPQAQAFIKRLVKEHGFDESELRTTLAGAKHRQDIIDLMRRPAEGKPWNHYRRIFITQKRIDGGIQFWRENEDAIQQASAKFGVDPQIIVAIIGVETMYGGNMGRHRVIDALATLAFDYPPRSRFFTKELEQFMLLAREEGVPVDSLKGSYAGAMGYGQFIPSSYRHYAVDGDGDGHRDLLGNTHDAIFSVANYFARHGWKKGQPITEQVDVGGPAPKASKGLKPSRTVASLRNAGIELKNADDGNQKVTFMELETDSDQPEYWVGYHNFYVITRYNHSHKYAMAVYQLSRAIDNGHSQGKNRSSAQ
ncbi:MAG: lytic murein transglycosylase B [Gammaproteobacteria bacterium]